MPRRETPFLPDQYYHFYNRGNNRQRVFFERANYLYFLNGIRKYLCGSMDVPAYCLMPTHYHLLVPVKPLPHVPPTRILYNSSSLVSTSIIGLKNKALKRAKPTTQPGLIKATHASEAQSLLRMNIPPKNKGQHRNSPTSVIGKA